MSANPAPAARATSCCFRCSAEHALLPAVRAAGPDAVVLADGFSCRTQLDQLEGRPSVHLAQLLAAAPLRG